MCSKLANTIEMFCPFHCFVIHNFMLVKVAFPKSNNCVIAIIMTREHVILFYHTRKITLHIVCQHIVVQKIFRYHWHHHH